MSRPESIENRWDILYRDYPDVYEAFSNIPYYPPVYEQLPGIVDLRDNRIADVGTGTGSSSLALAKFARQVIGIEREAAMLWQAQQKARGEKAARIIFLRGDALALPLADDSVDLVTGITLALYPPEQYRDFIRESLRVAKGIVVYVGIPPGWYGGDLYDVIEDVEKVDDKVDRIFIEEFQFAYQDIFSDQEYGTVEQIPENHPLLKSEATFQETLDVIKLLNAKRVVLTHIEEPDGLSYDDLQLLERQLQTKGLNIVFAYDTLIIDV